MAATQEQIDEVCAQVANGKTLRQIGAFFGVDAGTILKWIAETPEFTQQYARARDSAADLFETEIIEAAMSVGPETAAADRVKIDALKWVAARRAPKKYGDRVAQEISGPEGSAVKVDVNMTAEDAYKRLLDATT